MPQVLRRHVSTRWVLGAGIALSAITTIVANLGDLRRMASILGAACFIVGCVLLGQYSVARRTDRRLLRIAEQGTTQVRQLRTFTRHVVEGGDTGGDTGPQPLRSVK